jgi:hypothetical protein
VSAFNPARRGFHVLIVGLFLTASLSAEAQQTGTRINRNEGAVGSISNLDAKSAILATNKFAQCVARREGKFMRAALDLPFLSTEQTQEMRKRRNQFDECLGTSNEFDQLVLTPLLAAGGAAEWFVRTELKSVDLSSLSGMTDEMIEKTAYRPRNSLEDLGLCIVRRSPARATAFVKSAVSTKEETAAFKTIVPDVGPCVTSGTEIKLNLPSLRAVVAYALYRASSKLGAANA